MCLDQGLGIIPYFPLAGGILSGKYSHGDIPAASRASTDPSFNRFLEEPAIQLGQQVSRLAEEYGTTPSALSLAWLMDRPAVSTVIVGATRPDQLEDNLKSTGLVLKQEQKDKLDAVSEPFRYGKPFAVYRLP